MKNATFATAVIATSLLFTKPIHAQEGEIASPPVAASAQVNNDAIMSRLEATEKELQALKEQNSDLSTTVKDLQDAQSQSPADIASNLGKTRIFGFFDTSFSKLSMSGAMKPTGITEKSTFMLSGLYVYLGNQITEKLSFLSELRFTYQPLGAESGTATYSVSPTGAVTSLGTTYTRKDTSVTDPSGLQTYRLGGVSMERVQVSYVFADYLGLMVGSYLTPYGIWNVDHGTPVLIMCRAPMTQIMDMVPGKQLGLQLFGKVFPAKGLTLEYAATLSNGRGPMDTVYDLDNNKALGLRWKLNYEKGDFSASVGQYGFTGKYTDTSSATYIGPGPTDMKTVVVTSKQYDEYDLANDFLIKFYGLRLQSEVVLKKVKYSVPPATSTDASGTQYYSANYLSRAAYGLLAYELPESWTGGKVRVMPYFYEEWGKPDDTSAMGGSIRVNVVGINVRPYTNLVLKTEYVMVADTLKNFTIQLAVTF
jgi:hypothetical protein